jgi:3-dehydroquinate dehydratase II
MTPRILLIQGPNLTFLGRREPELYGTTTAAQLDEIVQGHAKRNGYTLDIMYSHIEGEAIGRIYQAVDQGFDGLVMNPAGFMYAGYAMRDCLSAVAPFLPYVEVHITNIEKRHLRSILAEKAVGAVFGFGVDSYLLGLDAMLRHLKTRATTTAHSEQTLGNAALAELLNGFLAAERAGAKALTEFMKAHKRNDEVWKVLRGVQADEAHNCALLGRIIEDCGSKPGHATGEFLEKALAVKGRRARIQFLIRGLGWMVKQIDTALPRVQHAEARKLLGVMRSSHQRSIAACEAVSRGLTD